MSLNQALLENLRANADMMKGWRRDIHAHPELGFKEVRTAELVATLLSSWGIEIETGIGGTGVVGKLRCGSSDRAIGLRADMDALPMQELNMFHHRSRHDGVFHGCGHDGHTAMLLGAAHYLAKNKELAKHKDFDGTVYFIFQPAEEGLGGALAMIEDGLFKRFPMQEVYGLHNYPSMDVGQFAIRPGPLMAAFTKFDIKIIGEGGHGAMPHHCVDPIVMASELVQAFQTIVSRNLDPLKTAVISVTQIQGGSAYNIIPNEVTLSGGVRFFEKSVGTMVKSRMESLTSGITAMNNARFEIEFDDTFVPLVNHEKETLHAIETVQHLVQDSNIDPFVTPICGSEDFAFMLEACPGAYILLGNGVGEGGCMIHHPQYDFNDDALVYGAGYWVALVQNRLKTAG